MIYNAYAQLEHAMGGILPISSGHIFAYPGREIDRKHGRSDWLLFYVAKGSEIFLIHGQRIEMQAGGFIIYEPHQSQQHRTESTESSEFYFMHFQLENAGMIASFGFATGQVYQAPPSRTVCDLFEAILREMQLKQTCYGEICAIKLMEILALLARRSAREHQEIRAYTERIAYIVQLMGREYQVSRSLEEYAALIHMSKFHFLRIFKKVTGVSPIAYRTAIRMEHAKEQLLETALPVGEIASSVGIASAAYFCDMFKKYTGLSPRAFREQGR